MTAGALRAYLQVSSAFESHVILDVAREGQGYALTNRLLGAPFRKDYDAVEPPLRWLELFDVSRWTLLSAFAAGRQVGGAIAAMDTPGVDMLEGRADLVVLWDLRVCPEARGAGIGTALFEAAANWGRAQGCIALKVETQNVNAAACALYRSRGCTLVQATAGAYPGLPDEVQMIWIRRLDG